MRHTSKITPRFEESKVKHIAYGCRVAFLLAALAAPGRVRPQVVSPSAPPVLRIPFTSYHLANGLTVVLAEDHATPTVAAEIMYHVGSKNEHAGHTGFAHLFEHVMFTGSGHVPYGLHDKYTEGVGGFNNGSTSNDVTQYYESM